MDRTTGDYNSSFYTIRAKCGQPTPQGYQWHTPNNKQYIALIEGTLQTTANDSAADVSCGNISAGLDITIIRDRPSGRETYYKQPQILRVSRRNSTWHKLPTTTTQFNPHVAINWHQSVNRKVSPVED